MGRGKARDRIFVLSLGGLPHSVVAGAAGQRLLPSLAGLAGQGAMGRMAPLLPADPAVAWATFMTGANPGKHGIFGYVDRVPSPFATHLPSLRDLKLPTLWEVLSRAGKRVGVMGVPYTYPPRQVSGFMVAGFPAPDLASAVFPADMSPKLLEQGYLIDVDTSLAGQDPVAFVDQLVEAMGRRFNACLEYMASEPWDFMQLHISALARLHHFFWGHWAAEAEGAAEVFEDLYSRLDRHIAELLTKLPPGCRLAVLSDYGYTAARGQVYLNHWLEQNGYLLFGRGRRELKNLHPDSRAYCLAGGRLYLNLEGREERGTVPQGRPAEELREELIHRLGGLADPNDGQPLIKAVHRGEDLYHGPQVAAGPDLVVEPAQGLEPRANIEAPGLLAPPSVGGTPLPDQGFLLLTGCKGELAPGSFSLVDVAPSLLALAEIAAPPNMDGKPLL